VQLAPLAHSPSRCVSLIAPLAAVSAEFCHYRAASCGTCVQRLESTRAPPPVYSAAWNRCVVAAQHCQWIASALSSPAVVCAACAAKRAIIQARPERFQILQSGITRSRSILNHNRDSRSTRWVVTSKYNRSCYCSSKKAEHTRTMTFVRPSPIVIRKWLERESQKESSESR
jgi:hypothetical protein